MRQKREVCLQSSGTGQEDWATVLSTLQALKPQLAKSQVPGHLSGFAELPQNASSDVAVMRSCFTSLQSANIWSADLPAPFAGHVIQRAVASEAAQQ